MALDRKELKRIVSSYPAKMRRRFLSEDDLLSNVIENARRAAKLRDGEFVALLDTTLFSSGKKGIVLTQTQLRIIGRSAPVELAGLEKVSCRGEVLSLVYADGHKEQVAVNTYAEDVCALLQAIVKAGGVSPTKAPVRKSKPKKEEDPVPAAPRAEAEESAPKPAPKQEAARPVAKVPSFKEKALTVTCSCGMSVDACGQSDECLVCGKEVLVHLLSEPGSPEWNRLLSQVKPGDTFFFGQYPQDALGREKTPILWQVLENKMGEVRLLSMYCLDVQPYHVPYHMDVVWQGSSLRKWLREEFMPQAFTPDQRRGIHSGKVTYYDENQVRYLSAEKIYLMGYKEMESLSWDVEHRNLGIQLLAEPTPYAKKKGAQVKTIGGRELTHWWLIDSYCTGRPSVTEFDTIETVGYHTHSSTIAVRPTLRLKYAPGSGK